MARRYEPHPARWRLLLTGAVLMMASGVWLMTANPSAGLAVYAIGAASAVTWVDHGAHRRAIRRRYRPRHSRNP